MEQPLPQCLSTNSVPRAFFPRAAIGCRLSLKIDRNLSPFWAGTLSVATWYNTAWIRGTASGEYGVAMHRNRHLFHLSLSLLSTMNGYIKVWFQMRNQLAYAHGSPRILTRVASHDLLKVLKVVQPMSASARVISATGTRPCQRRPHRHRRWRHCSATWSRLSPWSSASPLVSWCEPHLDAPAAAAATPNDDDHHDARTHRWLHSHGCGKTIHRNVQSQSVHSRKKTLYTHLYSPKKNGST